jgi:transglutaminase-like putative cysteine protease
VYRRLVIGLFGLSIAALVAERQPLAAADPEAARRAVERLTATGPDPAPPIRSDEEHADAIGPVLTPTTPLLYHDDGLPATDPRDARYIVSGGRRFVFDAAPRTPRVGADEPMLRIRPVDGGQHIAFLVRSTLVPLGPVLEDGGWHVVLPAPAIFRPEVELRRVWVAGRSVDATVLAHARADTVTVHVPVQVGDLRGPDGTPRPASVLLEGTLRLRDYRPVDPRKFAEQGAPSPSDPMAEIASLSFGRDYRDADEKEELVRAARAASAEAPDSYDQILAINSFVSSKLRYLESPVRRWPGEILEEGVGDCDDFTALTVALLRALAIPCRPMRGFLYDFGALAPHTWVEVALPLTGGGTHWFICDPTLAHAATDEEERKAAVQLRSRAHLYPAQPLVVPVGLPVHHDTDILFNVDAPGDDEGPAPADLERFMLDVSGGVARSFAGRADALSRSDLLLRRELPLSPGSSYVFTERIVTGGRSSLRTVLESDEGVVVELMAAGDGVNLGDEGEREVIEALRASYGHLDWLLFHGLPAHHCLELAYSRDPHSDHLQRVRLSFNRYLVRSHLRPIVKRMRKQGLWTDQEADLVDNLHRTSGGTNLYYLQELARRRAADSTLAP